MNMYLLMIFNNYTIEEMINYMGYSNKDEEIDSNMIFNSFYQDLYLLFDVEKDQINMGQIYQTFEDNEEFNCTNIFINFHYDVIEQVEQRMTGLVIKEKLHDICVISHINDFKNPKTIFERHFQFIKNGILTLTDFSYEGLNKNLEKTLIGRISFFFFTITIYIIGLTTSEPHKDSINKLMALLWERILITEIIFLIFGIGLIIIVIFFYIYNINKFFSQIFLLKKTFNISENNDQ